MEEQNNAQANPGNPQQANTSDAGNAQQTGAQGTSASGTHASSSATNEKNTVMGILSYLGPLVLFPYLVAKDDAFVKFHVKQGLVLLVGEVGIWFLGMIMWPLMPIIGIINLGFLVLIIIGIVNVAQGKEKELPLVGSLSKYFSF